jgi:hypothetical protein
MKAAIIKRIVLDASVAVLVFRGREYAFHRRASRSACGRTEVLWALATIENRSKDLVVAGV